MLYNSKINCEMNGHYAVEEYLAKNRNVEVRLKILKKPEVSGPMMKRKSSHNDYRGRGDWFS
jgi:hypothetical protein